MTEDNRLPHGVRLSKLLCLQPKQWLGGRGLWMLPVLLAAGCVASGSGTGEVVVRIVDQDGATIPIVAPIRLGDHATETDERGVARFRAVPAGKYDLAAEVSWLLPCPVRAKVRPNSTLTVQLPMRIGSIAMIGIVGKDGKLVGSYCQAEYPPCPGKPWSGAVIKPVGAEEIEKLAE